MKKKTEKVKKDEKKMSGEEARCKKEAEKAKEDEKRLEEKKKETEAASVSGKEKKKEKKKKVRKVNHSESSDEGCMKVILQARTKVPTLEKGMTHAKHKICADMWGNAMKKLGKDRLVCKDGVTNFLQVLDTKLLKTEFVRCIELDDKHTTIKHQEGWSIDKYIAEAQQNWEQIADMGYSVPVPVKCATPIRGLNLTEMQVHLIGSRLSIRAVDLEGQTVEGIKGSQYGTCFT